MVLFNSSVCWKMPPTPGLSLLPTVVFSIMLFSDSFSEYEVIIYQGSKNTNNGQARFVQKH